MLSVSQISKSYNLETILKDVSFSLNAGEKLGLIGPNGCGKTTLLRILMGLEQPDSGSYHATRPNLRVGYLPQGLVLSPDINLQSETIESYLMRQTGSPATLAQRLEDLATSLSNGMSTVELQRAYDTTLVQLEAAATSLERMPGILGALGLGGYSLDTPLGILSGGQKTRLALAGVLAGEPGVLFLDEPTNNLDIEMLSWLEDWLAGYRGAALVISHDRTFLDNVVTGILELDGKTHTLRAFPGNYSDYLEQKIGEQERYQQEYKDQQGEIARLRRAAAQVRHIARFRAGGKGDSGDKFAKGFFANRTKGTIARARHLERRLEELQTTEHIDKPRQDWQMKLDFGETPGSGRMVLALEDLAVGYEGRALLKGLNQHAWHGARIALIGPNGSGKTTLLRTIAGSLPPVEGSVRLGSGVRLGYMAQEQENLAPQLNALQIILGIVPRSETEARTFLHKYLFEGDDVFKPMTSLSYGERARLALATLVAQGCNLLLLDEPINHLDIPSRTRFEQALEAFDGTILAVTHDRYFIEGFASEVWEIQKQENNAQILQQIYLR